LAITTRISNPRASRPRMNRNKLIWPPECCESGGTNQFSVIFSLPQSPATLGPKGSRKTKFQNSTTPFATLETSLKFEPGPGSQDLRVGWY
jgi:hypothetical protein